MDEKIFLTTKEVTQYLGISASTIYRIEKKGLISSIKTTGGQRRFSKENVEKYLKNSRKFKAPQNQSKLKRKNEDDKRENKIDRGTERKINGVDSNELFYSIEKIKIFNADILKTKSVKDNSVDLIVTSPPYNVDIKYNSHKDAMTYEDYLLFTKRWIEICYKFIKEDGRFCLNIPLDKNKGGQQSVCADMTTLAKQIGFKYHSTIIWNEQNISRRTAWGSWLSASAPYVIAPVEVIIVLYKNSWKKTSGSKQSDITKEEFMEWTNGVWNFSGESKKRIGHPAPFPVELPRRCIKLFSFVGDTVLDPFMGSGSTLIACCENKRLGIGVEIDQAYCELARKRLKKECQLDQLKINFSGGE